MHGMFQNPRHPNQPLEPLLHRARSGGPMLKQSGAYTRAFGEFVAEQFKADWPGQGCAHMGHQN